MADYYISCRIADFHPTDLDYDGVPMDRHSHARECAVLRAFYDAGLIGPRAARDARESLSRAWAASVGLLP